MGAQLHFNRGAWSPSREIKNKLFQHRTYNANPLDGAREFMGRIDSGIDAFRLDAITFTRQGQLYCLALLSKSEFDRGVHWRPAAEHGSPHYAKLRRRDEQGMPLFGTPSLAWHHTNEE